MIGIGVCVCGVCEGVCVYLLNVYDQVQVSVADKKHREESGHDPLKFFVKRRGQGHVTPRFKCKLLFCRKFSWRRYALSRAPSFTCNHL